MPGFSFISQKRKIEPTLDGVLHSQVGSVEDLTRGIGAVSRAEGELI